SGHPEQTAQRHNQGRQGKGCANIASLSNPKPLLAKNKKGAKAIMTAASAASDSLRVISQTVLAIAAMPRPAPTIIPTTITATFNCAPTIGKPHIAASPCGTRKYGNSSGKAILACELRA